LNAPHGGVLHLLDLRRLDFLHCWFVRHGWEKIFLSETERRKKEIMREQSVTSTPYLIFLVGLYERRGSNVSTGVTQFHCTFQNQSFRRTLALNRYCTTLRTDNDVHSGPGIDLASGTPNSSFPSEALRCRNFRSTSALGGMERDRDVTRDP
jgi:hypothetical protein